jgi:hypothetical protein
MKQVWACRRVLCACMHVVLCRSCTHSHVSLAQGALNKMWQRRYFVLKNCKLYYFKSEESAQPQGIIPIDDRTVRVLGCMLCDNCVAVFNVCMRVAVCRTQSIAPTSSTSKGSSSVAPFAFTVTHHQHRVYLIGASDQSTVNDWYSMFQQKNILNCSDRVSALRDASETYARLGADDTAVCVRVWCAHCVRTRVCSDSSFPQSVSALSHQTSSSSPPLSPRSGKWGLFYYSVLYVLFRVSLYAGSLTHTSPLGTAMHAERRDALMRARDVEARIDAFRDSLAVRARACVCAVAGLCDVVFVQQRSVLEQQIASAQQVCIPLHCKILANARRITLTC